MLATLSISTMLWAYLANTVNANTDLNLLKPYLDSDVGSMNWDFGGDYIIDVESQFRLTPDAASKIGWLYSKRTLANNASFEVEMEYKIAGRGNFYGDGMALWFTQEKQRNGNAMGNAAKFKGMGIFIDTFPNSDRSHSYPYISTMLNNGDKVYDHEGDNAATTSGGCEAWARAQPFPTKLKVTYVKGAMLDLHVTTGPDQWKLCTRIKDITLPDNLYIGITAATGQVHDYHDLISLETRGVDESYGREHINEKTQAQEPGMHSGSFLSTIFKILAVLAVAGIVFIAYRSNQAGRSAKHF